MSRIFPTNLKIDKMKAEDLIPGLKTIMIVGESHLTTHHEIEIVERGDFVTRIKVTTPGFSIGEIGLPTNCLLFRINKAQKTKTTLVTK